MGVLGILQKPDLSSLDETQRAAAESRWNAVVDVMERQAIDNIIGYIAPKLERSDLTLGLAVVASAGNLWESFLRSVVNSSEKHPEVSTLHVLTTFADCTYVESCAVNAGIVCLLSHPFTGERPDIDNLTDELINVLSSSIETTWQALGSESGHKRKAIELVLETLGPFAVLLHVNAELDSKTREALEGVKIANEAIAHAARLLTHSMAAIDATTPAISIKGVL